MHARIMYDTTCMRVSVRIIMISRTYVMIARHYDVRVCVVVT